MSIATGPNVVTNGLVLCMDNANPRSYPGTGSVWDDLVTDTPFANGNYSWANNITAITIIVCLEKTGTTTGYASHPVNKWNNGTSNASFVLYHFGNFQNNGADGDFSWYYTFNSTWTGQYVTRMTLGQKMFTAFQWNSVTGGQTWFNNTIASGRSNSGTLGVNGTSGIVISGPESDGLTKVNYISFYNRDLSNTEILQNYEALRGRYGL